MPDLEHAQRRFHDVCEISKLLVTFESVEKTFDAALGITAGTIPLRSAILIEEREADSRMIVWPAQGQSAEMIAAAKANAENAYRYLVGASPREFLVLREEAGASELPGLKMSLVESLDRSRFMVLPLVVSRRPFGALQLEGAAELHEDDLILMNVIANQLALALDRHRAWSGDITMREEAEYARAEAEVKEHAADRSRRTAEALVDRHQALVDNLDRAFVWEAHAETLEVDYISAHVEQLLGHPRQKWLAAVKSWSEHVHPTDWPELYATFRRALKRKRNERCQHRFIASDGREVWFQTGVHPAESDDGFLRLQVVSIDITERVQSEEAQRFLLHASRTLGATLDSKALLRQLTQLGIPRLGDLCVYDAVVGKDEMVRAAWAHVDPTMEARMSEAWGGDVPVPVREHPLAKVVVGSRSELVSDLDDGWLTMAALSEPRSLMRELDVRSLMRVPVILGERRLGVLSFAFGSSGRRHTPAALSLAEELARWAAFALENGQLYDDAQRAIRAREQILGVVSHDLRNPLTSILMLTNLVGTRTFPDDVQPFMTTAVDRIERSANVMRRLIEDLVDFGSIQAGRLSIGRNPVAPAEIIDESVASFEAAAKARNVRLTAEIEPQLPKVDCDRERILQVFSNLIGNAVKVTRDGSIVVRAKLDGNQVLFAVGDTGPGIAEEDQEHIFERYWRSGQPRYKGSGLGLAISRGIVETHGGRIWCESKLGEGATFYFTLPVTDSTS